MEDATGQRATKGIQHSLDKVTLLSSPWHLGHLWSARAQVVGFMF